jgi:glycosyltransferase involved in cell wall biosynthesis
VVGRAIDSVLGQTYGDLELIVVDDGSTDGTSEVLAALVDPRFKQMHITHAGVGAARNAGAQAASGELLTFLDSDDEALPTWLDRIIHGFRDSAADVVICGGLSVDTDGQQESWVPAAGQVDPDWIAPRFLAGSWAVRTELFHRVGGYDERLTFGENTELALRLMGRSDVAITSVEEPLVRTYRGAGRQYSDAARAQAATAVLDLHRHQWRRFPELWASYHTVVGVDWARRGHPWRARYHFASALRANPLDRGRIARLLLSLCPGLTRRIWPGSPARPEVMFVVLAAGVGGSVRSLATVLAHVRGVGRVVARRPGTSTDKLLSERALVDSEVDLPEPSSHRLLDRARIVATLVRVAWQRRENLVAIHANGMAELTLALIPAWLAGCRIVVWVHDWELSPSSRRLAPILRAAHRTIEFAAVSEFAKSMIVSAGLSPAGRVRVVPNPIDPDDVRAEPSDTAVGPELRIGFVGTPAIYKGFEMLPDLVRATQDMATRWIVFAGPETMMPDVFAELRDLGVELPGKVLDVRAAYGECDVVVVPSRRESFGRVVAEAMTNGIPVVASDLEPIRDLVGDDRAGLLFPPGDVGAAAEAIGRLVMDSSLRQVLGAEGRLRCSRFAPGPIAEQLDDLYRGARGGGSEAPTVRDAPRA